jgi:hypothetical protein
MLSQSAKRLATLWYTRRRDKHHASWRISNGGKYNKKAASPAAMQLFRMPRRMNAARSIPV